MRYTNSSREYLAAINHEFARDTPDGSYVLDAGAGSQPYRSLFDHAHYESADFEQVDKQYGETTYVCDLQRIPVEDGRFDRVLLNQVLEHVPDPRAVLGELRRVLRVDGLILCTCPLFYEEHEEPYDYFRYTQYAHRLLFDEADLEIERLEWLEGYFGTVAYQFRTMSHALPRRRPSDLTTPREVLAWALVPTIRQLSGPLANAFSWLDRRAKITAAGYPKNYVVVARAR